MKVVYDEICNQCGGYIYDVEDVYQKLFQRIYNASTSLYYAVVFLISIPLGLLFSYYIFKKLPMSKTFRVFLFIFNGS